MEATQPTQKYVDDFNYVECRLEEAMQTLKTVWVGGVRPQQYKTNWPEMLIGFWEMWNDLSDPERNERREWLNRTIERPTPAQITRMDEVLPDWLYYIKQPRNRKIVMAVAAGASLRKTSRFDGRSHECIRYTYKQCIEDIMRGLGKGFDSFDKNRLDSYQTQQSYASPQTR